MARLYVALMLVFSCVSLETFAQSSDRTVKISAEIDGKVIKNEKLRIEVCMDEKKLMPQIIGDEFSLNFSNWVDVDKQDLVLRIFYKRYVVEFNDLSKDHFQGRWKFSITTAPHLDKTHLPNAENADYAYKIEFMIGNMLGTVRSKVKYKDKPFSY